MEKFTTRLVAKGPNGAWTHLIIPFDVVKVFGSKARVPVTGTLNDISFRNSVMPVGDGTHYMNINKELLAAANTKAGELVQVTMAIDKAERTVDVPEELQKSLKKNKEAASFFDSLAYSHKKEYVDWIVSAKKPETKTARVDKTIEMLHAKQRRDR
ncbi:YdeI/OmpD-associated family protein [Acidicapsa ligni]|uniref:YdeI/OmpD-associated family protein n=1 Tax=Acidicapsa ligni TaxID=542300 RepID=UPI0021DFF0B1|nr:YdeI/OmpD-associated family protein [Acidicapsa ligni]